MAKKYEDTNGSNEWMRQQQSRQLAATYQLGQMMAERDLGGFIVTQITIKGPALTGSGFLATIKGENETGNKSVAFDGAETLPELITSIKARVDGDALRWRDDIPYAERVKAQKASQGG